jgi:hypothetical protein
MNVVGQATKDNKGDQQWQESVKKTKPGQSQLVFYYFRFMKHLLLFFLVFVSFSANAQNDSARIRKYRLALPEQWMGKRSVLDQLLRTVPTVFPRLKEASFCLKCKTPYTLMFFYDSLVVKSRIAEFKGTSTEYRWGRTREINNYECITTYHIKATWVLLYKDSAVAELEIVSPSENVTAIKKFSMQNNVIILSSLKKRPVKTDFSIFDDPLQFVNKYPESFDPDADDILAVIIERIRKIEPE